MQENFTPNDLDIETGGEYNFSGWTMFDDKKLDKLIFKNLGEILNKDGDLLKVFGEDLTDDGDIEITARLWLNDELAGGPENPHVRTSIMRVINEWVVGHAHSRTRPFQLENEGGHRCADDARRLVAALRLKADQIEAIIKDG